MRYYVVINGESSLNIQGLAIQSLPNISKPLMRSRREEIDGRDGDIITKLGYSAYDKTLKIGLWGNYDINQVIAFFNQEGVITFSNEPDKYYNFTILNREDYINKLEAFREASITIHCQPFKYEINEQPIELENEYITKTDTSMTFDNSVVATIEDISLKGNTLQNGTPTPSSPIPVNNVSGDNDIVVCGKNLFDIDNLIFKNGYYDNSGNWVSMNANGTFEFVNVLPNTQYTLSLGTGVLTNGNIAISEWNNTTFIKRNMAYGPAIKSTITTNANTTRISITINYNGSTAMSKDLIKGYQPQLEYGSTATTYEAYNGTIYNIDLPVENLLDDSTYQVSGNTTTISNHKLTLTNLSTNGWCRAYYKIDDFVVGQKYTISCDFTNTNNSILNITIQDSNNSSAIATGTSTTASSGKLTLTFTATTTTHYIRLYSNYSATPNTNVVECSNITLNKGEKTNSFVPYGTTPIELNKIGTYQDYFYKENDKWYLHKEVGKITLNGTENISKVSASNKNIYNINNIPTDYLKSDGNITGICNFLSCIRQYQTDGDFTNNAIDNSFSMTSGNGNKIRTRIDSITTTDDLKTYLTNNLTYIYYILETPTNTEITYTPLIEQLESIKNAMSKEGITNVNQVNNDAPFIITASVLCGGNSVVVNNKGNIYSKPIMTIYGSGNIGVYLSDSQIFNINLGDEEYITLDTTNMEAYKVGVLKNRLVNGDYNSFRLETGNNTISFTGNVTKVELDNYSRWI